MRARTRDIDSGVPSGFKKWAEQKLAVLHALRLDLNLPKMQQAWIFNGFDIRMWDSEFGDYLRIKGGAAKWFGQWIQGATFLRRVQFDDVDVEFANSLEGVAWREISSVKVSGKTVGDAYALITSTGYPKAVSLLLPDGTSGVIRSEADLFGDGEVGSIDLYTNNSFVGLNDTNSEMFYTSSASAGPFPASPSVGVHPTSEDFIFLSSTGADPSLLTSYLLSASDRDVKYLDPPQTPVNPTGLIGSTQIVKHPTAGTPAFRRFSARYRSQEDVYYIARYEHAFTLPGPPIEGYGRNTIPVVRASTNELALPPYGLIIDTANVLTGGPFPGTTVTFATFRDPYIAHRGGWALRYEGSSIDTNKAHGWIRVTESGVNYTLDNVETQETVNEISAILGQGPTLTGVASLEIFSTGSQTGFETRLIREDNSYVVLAGTVTTNPDTGRAVNGQLQQTAAGLHMWLFPPTNPSDFSQGYDAQVFNEAGALVLTIPNCIGDKSGGPNLPSGETANNRRVMMPSRTMSYVRGVGVDGEPIILRSDGGFIRPDTLALEKMSYQIDHDGNPVVFSSGGADVGNTVSTQFYTLDNELNMYIVGTVNGPPFEAPTPDADRFLAVKVTWSTSSATATAKKLYEGTEGGNSISLYQGTVFRQLNELARFDHWGL